MAGYATVHEDCGVNYREIASLMTQLGYDMNHSSARNWVLRIMRKFAVALTRDASPPLSEERLGELARNPIFQSAVADLLHLLEAERRKRG